MLVIVRGFVLSSFFLFFPRLPYLSSYPSLLSLSTAWVVNNSLVPILAFNTSSFRFSIWRSPFLASSDLAAYDLVFLFLPHHHNAPLNGILCPDQYAQRCGCSVSGHDDARDRSLQYNSEQIPGGTPLPSISYFLVANTIWDGITGYAMRSQLRLTGSQNSQAV